MDDSQLKQLFESQEIPAPNDNKRKETLNLAAAAFEKNQKTVQGTSLWGRLINRQPATKREKMTVSQKKIMYGGLATACVALMVFAVSPYSRFASTQESVEARIGPVNNGASFNQIAENPAVPDPLPDSTFNRKIDSAPSGMELSADDRAAAFSGQPAAPAKPADGSDKLKKEMVANEADAGLMADRAEMMPEPQQKAAAVGQVLMAPTAPPVASVPAPLGGYVAPVDTMIARADAEIGRDKFKDFQQNDIKQVAQDPISTFSIDVDTASYAFMRQSLGRGVLPQTDSIRVEELINYFDYAYPLPTSREEPFKATVAIKPSPWHEGRKLMTVGIKGFDVDKAQAPDSNLVFLLDVSGSMDEPNKLPLLKQSMTMLLDSLKPTDKVSIVVYAGAAGMVLPPTEVANKSAILMALQNLQPGGSTAGAEGIRLAYQLAESNFKKDAVNRVILATDGDFNVGITNPEELQSFIEHERDSGVFLSVLGFGTGNYNDDMMQRLAQNGNGVTAYIDNLNEARKVLVQEAGATLFSIAKDVKIQVEFNPDQVSEYRLVGYETRALKTEDFNNDKVDAGDIGAGAEVTAYDETTPSTSKRLVCDTGTSA